MSALPYMQLYIADYLADTAHLTTVEHGAYLLLIFNYWQRGESFSAKNQRSLNGRLASVARMSNEDFEKIRETLEEFFEVTETEWRHARIEFDLEEVNSRVESASRAGKASAEKRKNAKESKEKPPSNVQRPFNDRSTENEQPFNHKDTDTDKNIKKEITNVISKEAVDLFKDIPEWLPVETWKEWIDHRVSIKKPLTANAARLSFKKLAKFKADGYDVIEIIETSIDSHYQGLFKPNGSTKGLAINPKNQNPTKHDIRCNYMRSRQKMEEEIYGKNQSENDSEPRDITEQCEIVTDKLG